MYNKLIAAVQEAARRHEGLEQFKERLLNSGLKTIKVGKIAAQEFLISNRGGGTLYWTISVDIPTDGSTINVYVDGVNLGLPTYDIYRSDIAGLFPGYVNSDGAAGYFSLDTTGYANDLHTIRWIATDNAGNRDGIGSRYFTIRNTGNNASAAVQGTKRRAAVFMPRDSALDVNMTQIPTAASTPVRMIKGFHEDAEPRIINPDGNGDIIIEIKELERVEIHFLEGTGGLAPLFGVTGFLLVGSQLRPLPIGSYLDTEKGIFYWQPGPGFYGNYEFVFIKSTGTIKEKVRIMIRILPK